MSYIIDRTNYLFSPNDSPYKNARLVEVHEPFERQLSKGVTEKGSRIEKKWITDDDPLTVYTNEGRIVVQDTGYSEYPSVLRSTTITGNKNAVLVCFHERQWRLITRLS